MIYPVIPVWAVKRNSLGSLILLMYFRFSLGILGTLNDESVPRAVNRTEQTQKIK